jgi:hypothetical protein
MNHGSTDQITCLFSQQKALLGSYLRLALSASITTRGWLQLAIDLVKFVQLLLDKNMTTFNEV